MRRAIPFVLSAAGLLVTGSSALAENSLKLDDVLKSINESSRGDQQTISILPFALVILAVILMYTAVKHWNRIQTKPKVLNSHAKLLKEAAKITGISAKNLKNLESLAKAQGMSSPLVAMICPSSIGQLARSVKTQNERKAVTELSTQLLSQ